MIKFTGNSPWQAWVDFCREIDSTRDDFDPVEENFPLVVWARGLGGLTFYEAVRGPCISWQGSGFLAWAVSLAWRHIAAPLRMDVLTAIGFEPPMAALTWRQLEDAMSSSEKAMLWSAFVDAMPSLASEIGGRDA